MNPREIVKRTLEFASPPRIARQLWTLPWAELNHAKALADFRLRFPDDIITAPGFYRKPLITVGDAYTPGTYIDEWGCNFTNIQAGLIGEVKNPVVDRWENLGNVHPPLDSMSIDVEKINTFCHSSDHFVLGGCCPRPFERSQFLRGSQNFYLDLATGTEELKELIKIVHEFYLKELELWACTEVDGLMFMDDWGSQRALLISPRQWREIFKPLYREYIQVAKNHGKYIFMHSDGYIADVIPDLIELGLDALNSQIFCMGVEKLGERFAGQITFWGEIDRQHLLPFGTAEEIIDGVTRAYGSLYRNGGAIAQCEFGAGAKPENVFLVFETWEKLGSAVS